MHSSIETHPPGSSPMTRNTVETRRRLLAFLGALPVSFFSVSSKAQPRQLKVSSYFHGETPSVKGAQLFADKATEDSAGTIQASLEAVPPWVPFEMLSKLSAFAHFFAPDFANVEPILGLSALPMLTATFDEADTLLRIARPYYGSALARHGQILLATQPWRPVALWSTFRIRSAADLQGCAFPISSNVGERAGWGRTFIRSGARRASLSETESMLSDGYTINIDFTREFAYFTEIFLAAQLNFLTVSREAFDSLTETQRHVLVATGRKIELSQWKLARELVHHDQQEIAARGVPVAGQPPADVLATLRKAAEPDVQGWAESVGKDGATILADYRRTIWHA
jgi:TRAP-type C4-dicarboxylate transport system substrate-binding protein